MFLRAREYNSADITAMLMLFRGWGRLGLNYHQGKVWCPIILSQFSRAGKVVCVCSSSPVSCLFLYLNYLLVLPQKFPPYQRGNATRGTSTCTINNPLTNTHTHTFACHKIVLLSRLLKINQNHHHNYYTNFTPNYIQLPCYSGQTSLMRQPLCFQSCFSILTSTSLITF